MSRVVTQSTRVLHAWIVRLSQLSTSYRTVEPTDCVTRPAVVKRKLTARLTILAAYLFYSSSLTMSAIWKPTRDANSNLPVLVYAQGNVNLIFGERYSCLMNTVCSLTSITILIIHLADFWLTNHDASQSTDNQLPWDASSSFLTNPTGLRRSLRLKLYLLHTVASYMTVVVLFCIYLYANFHLICFYPSHTWLLCVIKVFWLAFYNFYILTRFTCTLFVAFTGLLTQMVCHAHHVRLKTGKIEQFSTNVTQDLTTHDIYPLTSLLSTWRQTCYVTCRTTNIFIASFTPIFVSGLLVFYFIIFLDPTWQMRLMLFAAIVANISIFLCLLLFASLPAWHGRRITSHTLFSIACRLLHNDRFQNMSPSKLIKSLTKINTCDHFYCLLLMPINFATTSLLICEGIPYFLLLITILGT